MVRVITKYSRNSRPSQRTQAAEMAGPVSVGERVECREQSHRYPLLQWETSYCKSITQVTGIKSFQYCRTAKTFLVLLVMVAVQPVLKVMQICKKQATAIAEATAQASRTLKSIAYSC